MVIMTYFGIDANYFSNANIQFYEFSVDELIEINSYFQSVDGAPIVFDEPVVIHLVFTNKVKHQLTYVYLTVVKRFRFTHRHICII